MAGQGDRPSLGQLLIDRGMASEADVNRCVAIQRKRASQGDFARLGQILVEQGVVTRDQVSDVLGVQRITIMVCSVCRAQYNIQDYQSSQDYECRNCGGGLRRPKSLDSLTIQDTVRGRQRKSARQPAGQSQGRRPSDRSSDRLQRRPQRAPGPQDTVRASPRNRPRPPTGNMGRRANQIGDYLVLGEIARGGMGVIYKARQLGLDRLVALKTLNAAESNQPDAVERFQREARAVASLRHPNLVAIHTVDCVNGVHFFTMEFVEGIPLDALLKKEGPITAERAATLLCPIIDALAYAHSKGVVHRDLKPANIIIDKNNQPFLVDFGIAKVKGERQLTQAGEILGSVPYMAPEYVMGEAFTEACDVYSFGVVLYEAIAGFENLPFGSDNDPNVETIRILKRIAYEAPEPIRQFCPGIDPMLEQIVMRAITRDLSMRYSSAAELARDLHSWLSESEPKVGGSAAALSEATPPSPSPLPAAVQDPELNPPREPDAAPSETSTAVAAPPEEKQPDLTGNRSATFRALFLVALLALLMLAGTSGYVFWQQSAQKRKNIGELVSLVNELRNQGKVEAAESLKSRLKHCYAEDGSVADLIGELDSPGKGR